MNSLIAAFILILWLVLGYKIYGSFIEKKVVKPDNSRLTPARELRDGIDYTPTKKPILFGHHFSIRIIILSKIVYIIKFCNTD